MKSVEVSRSNVTLKAFFAVVKKACEKKGREFSFIHDQDLFEKPLNGGEDSRYYVKDGIQYYSYNGYIVKNMVPNNDTPCKREIYRTKPLDYQIFFENWDGTFYNEICEFTFTDNKKGFGYYYQNSKE